ncbi:MAG: ATP-binding protein [Gammaproteobacteria bacterium]|nr:ATP-binding protein [Gammaproteobacteria bacterium]
MSVEVQTERRPLPIGIQTFSVLREEGCYYVDKTPLIRDLIRSGRYYFLSRPRRFGKSLLVDTLKELFEANEPLFCGLDIHERWDWSVRYPVVRLSFGGGNYDQPGSLENNLLNQIYGIEKEFNLESLPSVRTGPERLHNLLRRLHHETGERVVVLVDEYDKPVLDAIDQPDVAIANRKYLRGIYGTIKDCANDVRFVFVTGVSMFTKTSLFSEMNNLENISLDPAFATVCGYTDNDLDTVFAPELPGLDRGEVRRWYNGYHWLGQEKLYNPYDLLLLFKKRQFKPHWFETGSPEFLYSLLSERDMSPMQLENLVTDEELVSRLDVKNIGVDSLLFQTGYLTIVGEERRGDHTQYRLDYPNYEVRRSFNKGLLEYLAQHRISTVRHGEELVRLLAGNDFQKFAEKFQFLLKRVPYPWHHNGGLGRYEAWYASMLYMIFRAIGIDLQVEDMSSHGRADMVVFHDGQIFVFEFKMVGDGSRVEDALDRAITQIREKEYAEKYRGCAEPIHLIGIVFGRQKRNLLAIRAELL